MQKCGLNVLFVCFLTEDSFAKEISVEDLLISRDEEKKLGRIKGERRLLGKIYVRHILRVDRSYVIVQKLY